MSSDAPTLGQREYARIETHLVARVRRAKPEEIEAFEERVVGADVGEDDLPLALVAYLRSIEYKLDLVLSRLDSRFETPLDPQDLRPVVLSAGGLCVEQPATDLAVGDPVRVQMLLPGDAPRTIDAMGRVTRILTVGAGPNLAIEYTAIDEGDRDAIVRLVNRLQLALGRRPKDPR
jgi:hypothetical protein